MTITADATDDIWEAEVEFLVDGAVVHRDFRAPFEHSFVAPQGVAELELGARALDLAGNEGVAEPSRVTIEPDADPTTELLHLNTLLGTSILLQIFVSHARDTTCSRVTGPPS